MDTPATITEIPSNAYGVTAAELKAWQKQGGPGFSGVTVTVFAGPCQNDHFEYAGYLQPSNVEGTMFISGWFHGRRSVAMPR